MRKPSGTVEIFLQPGEYFFSDRATRIRTILGSCVAVTFWHPKLLLGGMCHIMLPTRSSTQDEKVANGKYADEAIQLLISEMKNAGTEYKDYQVKIFGGGDMFANHSKVKNQPTIGEKNINEIKELVKSYGFKVHAEHLGGEGHRYIIFDIWCGYVWMRHNTLGKATAHA
jgi:chemotaxis protein CheD